MTAFIPCLAALHLCSSLPVSHNSLLMQEWWPPVSAGLSAVLVCLLFVARDWGTDGVLRFPLQRVSSTKCIIVQNGFCCTNFFYTVSYLKKKQQKNKNITTLLYAIYNFLFWFLYSADFLTCLSYLYVYKHQTATFFKSLSEILKSWTSDENSREAWEFLCAKVMLDL